MQKIELDFMVVPEELIEKTFVPRAVKVKILDAEYLHSTGLLGESGYRMALSGLLFYFEKGIAEELIARGLMIEVE